MTKKVEEKDNKIKLSVPKLKWNQLIATNIALGLLVLLFVAIIFTNRSVANVSQTQEDRFNATKVNQQTIYNGLLGIYKEIAPEKYEEVMQQGQ